MPLFLTKANTDSQFMASCSASLLVGDLVYVTGSIQDDLVPVAKVDISDQNMMPAIGIVVEKTMPDLAVVQRFGIVDLPELTGSVSPGAVVFAGADGRPTSTAPSSVLGAVPLLVQIVGVGTGSGSLELAPMLNMTKIRP